MSTHADDCWGCGPKHYEYEVRQYGVLQASGREVDYASAKSKANHYAMMYIQDGPVEVVIYEKRLITWIPSVSSSRLGEEDRER